jgi:ribosome-associated heat shock protein Hsp15
MTDATLPARTELSKNAAGVRVDVWLWATRFFKTRSLAKTMIENGRVLVNGERVKPAKLVHVNHEITITRGDDVFVVLVHGVSEQRSNASVAATLYQETAASIAKREAMRERLKLERAGYRAPEQKPDKQARRALQQLKASSSDDRDGSDERFNGN